MRGGGVTFAPKPRSFAFDLPQRVVNMSLRVALSAKFKEGNLVILKDSELASHRTKGLMSILREHWQRIYRGQIAFLTAKGELDPNFGLAARTVYNIDFYDPSNINTYDLVKRHHLVVTQSGLKALEGFLLKVSQRTKVKFKVDRPIAKMTELPRITVPRHRHKQAVYYELQKKQNYLKEGRKLRFATASVV